MTADVLRDLARAKVAFQLRAIEAVIGFAASGMEAREGGNEVPSRSDDSPVAESETPNTSRPSSSIGEGR